MTVVSEKDVINFDYIQIFTFYNYTVFLINTVMLLFFAYLVYICTNKNQMKNYRLLMAINLICIFSKEVVFVLWQPIKLFSFDIIFSSGLLVNASSKIFAIGVSFIVILLPLFGDTLELLFLERHFSIAAVINPNAKNLRKFTYLFMSFTYLTAVVVNVVFILSCVDDERIAKILNSSYPNIATKVGANPSMIILDAYNNTIGIIFGGIYVISRLLIALWMIYENSRYSKNPNYAKSENSRKQFKLMFQTTVIQLFTFLAFGLAVVIYVILAICPINFDGFNLAETLNLPLIFLLSVGISMLYPVAFCTLAILFIKSYRSASLKLLCFKRFVKQHEVENNVVVIQNGKNTSKF